MNTTDKTKRAWDAKDVYVAASGDMPEANRRGVNFYKTETGEIRWRMIAGSKNIGSNESFHRLAGAQKNLASIFRTLDQNTFTAITQAAEATTGKVRGRR